MGNWTLLVRYFCSCKLKGSKKDPFCSRFVDAKVFMPEFNLLSRNLIVSPISFSMPHEIVGIKTADDLSLMGFLILHTAKAYNHLPTIIVYHGNGGNIGDCLPLAEVLYRALECNILIVDYRGYGFSQGVPSENGVYMDAQATFDFVERHPDLDSSKIIVYGISMGGAIAVDLATQKNYKYRIGALILENTFSSLLELVLHQMPKCCSPIFPTFRKIPKVVCPTLFISGLSDTFIPPEHMTRLFSESKAEYKKIIRFPEGGHLNTFAVFGYGELIADFIFKALEVPSIGSQSNQNFQSQESINSETVSGALSTTGSSSKKQVTIKEFLHQRQ